MKKLIILVIFLAFAVSTTVAYAQTTTSIKIEIRGKDGGLLMQDYLSALAYDVSTSTMVINLRDAAPAGKVIFKIDGVVQSLKSATIEIQK